MEKLFAIALMSILQATTAFAYNPIGDWDDGKLIMRVKLKGEVQGNWDSVFVPTTTTGRYGIVNTGVCSFSISADAKGEILTEINNPYGLSDCNSPSQGFIWSKAY